MKKLISASVLLAVIAGLGYVWFSDQMEAAERRGRAEVYLEEVKPLQKRYADMVVLFGHRDSLRSALVDSVKAEHAEDTLALQKAHERSDSLIARLDSAMALGGPVDVEVVQETVGGLQTEIGVCSRALRSCEEVTFRQDTMLADLRGQLSFADSLIVKQSQAIRALGNMPGKDTTLPWLIAGSSLLVSILILLR